MMHFRFTCFCWSLFLIHGFSLVNGRYVGDYERFGAPLDVDCFKDIKIPLEPIDKTFPRDVERSVLHQIYLETDGHNWVIQKGWSSFTNTTNMSQKVDQCANWTGVTCKDGYVIGLSLSRNNLTGRVPNTLWKLRNLRVLCLPSNHLYGQLDDFIFPNMTKLLRIDLAFCHLTGQLPNKIFAALKFLQKIQLSSQKSLSTLDGPIPDSISNLTDLQVLSLGENNFGGAIPLGIGKLKKLWFLDLEFMNGLNGNISLFLGMTSLISMHLANAGIYGELPNDFGTFFPHLYELQLQQNRIYGKIPSSMNRMSNLTKILMNFNSLYGVIPKSLGNMPSLRVLDLSNNGLEALDNDLSFKGSSNLEILLLENNSGLSAKIQTLINALVPTDRLKILRVGNCNFHGEIDSKIWKMTSLMILNLEKNNIEGYVPEVHEDTLFLTTLNLSNNNFQGPIPNNFDLLKSLMYLDIRGNYKMRAPMNDVNITSRRIQDFIVVKQQFRPQNIPYICPFATLTHTNGSVLLDSSYYDNVFCVCGEGYYGSHGKCKRCLSNGDCSSETPLASNKNYMQISMRIARGYWPSPSIKNVTHLIECPRLPDEDDWVCNPLGDCKCWLHETTRTTVCNESCICHDGNTKWMCSKCVDGYYKSGSLCIKCYNQSTDTYAVFPIIIALLLSMLSMAFCCRQRIGARFALAVAELVFLLFLRFFDVIAGWILEVGVVLLFFSIAGITKNTRGIISILVFYIQVLDAMISVNTSSFPDFIKSLQYHMNSVMNLHFTGFSCKFPFLVTPFGKYMLTFLFPIVCLVSTWLAYGIFVIITKIFGNAEFEGQSDPLRDTRTSFKKVSIAILRLTFFPVSRHTIAVLAPCKQDGDYSYLRFAPWVQCSEEDRIYGELQVSGWFGVVIYVIGVPVFLQILLIWYRRNKDHFSDEDKNLCDSWLGTIYLPYKQDVESYFEVLKLLFKLLIAVFLAVFDHLSSIQTVTVSMVLLAALIYQLKWKPYADHGNGKSFENALEVIILTVLHLSFVMLRFASYDKDSNILLVWAVIALNIGVIIAFLVAIPSVIINTCCSTIAERHAQKEEEQPILFGPPQGGRCHPTRA